MQGVRRIITGVSGSPGSLRALRYAADLARANGAGLVPVLAWLPPGGEVADRRFPSVSLREAWRTAAARRLDEAIELALGEATPEIALCPAVLRGEAKRVLVKAACEPGDVLVVGTGSPGRGARLMGAGAVSRYCLRHASCPVTTVPPSELAVASSGLRGWALRHRSLTPDDPHLDAAQRR